jgi:hypothetical protein
MFTKLTASGVLKEKTSPSFFRGHGFNSELCGVAPPLLHHSPNYFPALNPKRCPLKSQVAGSLTGSHTSQSQFSGQEVDVATTCVCVACGSSVGLGRCVAPWHRINCSASHIASARDASTRPAARSDACPLFLSEKALELLPSS